MTGQRLPFVDWMKAIGMALIVFGHSGGGSLVRPTDPANLKQLGVAFFVFVSGYTLARESRSTRRVLVSRLFEVFLFGWLFAIVLSIVNYFRIGDINESNYLPLILGVNVLFNSFPANPTTWYIGTYLHLLLLWALVFRRIDARFWMIPICLCLDVGARAALMSVAGDYVAYQFVTNWMTLLLVGMWAGQQRDEANASWHATIPIAIQMAVTVGWMTAIRYCDFGAGNPFMRSRIDGGFCASVLFASSCIGLLYVVHTWLIYEAARRLPDVRLVRFFARNTLIIFIVHMPLIHVLNPYVSPIFAGRPWLRVTVNFGIYFVGVALLSELLRRLLRPRVLRSKTISMLESIGAFG